jgi:transposase
MKTSRDYRKTLGLSQREVAEKFGVCLSTYSRWERMNDPKSWEALGVKTPKDADPVALNSKPVLLTLSKGAAEILKRVPHGTRSGWVSDLIEQSGDHHHSG